MPLFPETQEEFAQRIDEPNSSLNYFGKAVIASVDSAAVWQIKRLTVSGNVTTIEWADGNEDFDNVWDDRTILTYS